jgi:hypothetical protein
VPRIGGGGRFNGHVLPCVGEVLPRDNGKKAEQDGIKRPRYRDDEAAYFIVLYEIVPVERAMHERLAAACEDQAKRDRKDEQLDCGHLHQHERRSIG